VIPTPQLVTAKCPSSPQPRRLFQHPHLRVLIVGMTPISGMFPKRPHRPILVTMESTMDSSKADLRKGESQEETVPVETRTPVVSPKVQTTDIKLETITVASNQGPTTVSNLETEDSNRVPTTVASRAAPTITTVFNPGPSKAAEEASKAARRATITTTAFNPGTVVFNRDPIMVTSRVVPTITTAFNRDLSKAAEEASMASKAVPQVIAGIHRSIQTMMETTIFRVAALPTMFKAAALPTMV